MYVHAGPITAMICAGNLFPQDGYVFTIAFKCMKNSSRYAMNITSAKFSLHVGSALSIPTICT
jgi:hypothetical protein